MGKYLFKRILFSILSLIVVVGIVMILVYTAIHRNVVLQTDDLYHDDRLDDVTRDILAIQTYYESMWIARGLNIKYMKWQLPREGTLEEPDVEIELDDYRSYHRSKRSSLDKAK
jgi:hypothetical protein